MTPGCYFNKVLNTAFHDLSNGAVPFAARFILGNGLTFIPTPTFTTPSSHASESCERLERDVNLKCHFAGDTLEELPDSKLYVKSVWQPPWQSSEIDTRLARFNSAITSLVKRRRGQLNLNSFHRKLLAQLRRDHSIVICHADKNLGPVAVTIDWYIKAALKHLKDALTYELISEEQALEEVEQLRSDILAWTFEFRPVLTDSHVGYIRKKLEDTIDDPFGYFYLLIKLHKSPVSTRPVCSDCGSLPHALGQWVDEMLQPIVKAQPTYFKNSFALKKELELLEIPPNASLYTYDAVSMYTNINTEECIRRLTEYLLSATTYRRFQHYHPKALIEAIKLVMRNNRMRFGDILVKQIRGIAMGMSPAPTIANLFVALYENEKLLQYLQTFLLFLKRFIDDGIGIWLHDSDPIVDELNWTTFQQAVNAGGLEWTFTERSKSVVFMDMTIEIVKGKIETRSLALYLYIPPHSCHAPGVLTGLIFGNVLRIYQLCTREVDIEDELRLFLHRLLDRGYHPKKLLPIFSKAMENAKLYLSRSDKFREDLKLRKQEESRRQVFYHLPYHPNNPSSSQVQKLWRQLVSHPTGNASLNCVKVHGTRVPIDRMIVCYSRAPNLGNLLSYRKICGRSGPKVSSYL